MEKSSKYALQESEMSFVANEIASQPSCQVTPSGVVRGWVEVAGGRIRVLGAGTPTGRDLGAGCVLPGFIDLHVRIGDGEYVLGAMRVRVTR
jgi:imidazolonepropionase-like amidohydrolase